jgi:lysylphosphatidylglycerol synthetase-like protein (DUF2156 family)
MTFSQYDALSVLEDQGQSSSAFLCLNEGNRYFTSPECAGMITYRPVGRTYWIQFTGACAQKDLNRKLLDDAFAAEAARARKRVVALQLSRSDAERAAAAGCVVNQLGCSYSIDLSSFAMRGQKFVKTRNMIARSRREGVVVSEATAERLRDPEFVTQLDRIDAEWLRDKGRHVKELQLMIGERGGVVQDRRRLFFAAMAGRVVAYISYSPVYGAHPGWLYDLTRRLPYAPPGVIEHIFAEAAEIFRDEGSSWVHLGFTPFVGIESEHRVPGATSQVLAKAISVIRERGSILYPAKNQLAFKLKWRPHHIVPEYIAVRHHIRLRDVWCVARATNCL